MVLLRQFSKYIFPMVKWLQFTKIVRLSSCICGNFESVLNACVDNC